MQCRVIRLIIAVTRGSRNIRRRDGATLSDRWVLTRCVCSPLAAKESEGTFDCVDGATWKCDKWTQWPISYKVWNFHRNRSKNSEHLSPFITIYPKWRPKTKFVRVCVLYWFDVAESEKTLFGMIRGQTKIFPKTTSKKFMFVFFRTPGNVVSLQSSDISPA